MLFAPVCQTQTLWIENPPSQIENSAAPLGGKVFSDNSTGWKPHQNQPLQVVVFYSISPIFTKTYQNTSRVFLSKKKNMPLAKDTSHRHRLRQWSKTNISPQRLMLHKNTPKNLPNKKSSTSGGFAPLGAAPTPHTLHSR